MVGKQTWQETKETLQGIKECVYYNETRDGIYFHWKTTAMSTSWMLRSFSITLNAVLFQTAPACHSVKLHSLPWKGDNPNRQVTEEELQALFYCKGSRNITGKWFVNGHGVLWQSWVSHPHFAMPPSLNCPCWVSLEPSGMAPNPSFLHAVAGKHNKSQYFLLKSYL